MFGRIFRRPLTVLFLVAFAMLATSTSSALASEADLAIPDLHAGSFKLFGGTISAWNLLFYGALVICGTLGISLYLKAQIRALPAHRSMLAVADIIYATCKTYLLQQAKFLMLLFVLIAIAISYYMLGFSHDTGHGAPKAAGTSVAAVTEGGDPTRTVAAAAAVPTTTAPTEAQKLSPSVTLMLVLFFAIVGMGGSFWVAW